MPMPGEGISNRPLPFYWIIDCSGSMADGKIQSVNAAVRECIPEMRRAADENPAARIMVRTIVFSNGARWNDGGAVSVDSFSWNDLTADGPTDMGQAFALLQKEFSQNMPSRAIPPVVVLMTDGEPTDEYNTSLTSFLNEPWAKKAVKIGVAVGESAKKDPLIRFAGNSELVLEVHNAQQMVNFIKWVSTAVISSASSGQSDSKNRLANVSVPIVVPADLKNVEVDDAW